ncbi:MAG: hypothetical protein IKU72_01975 [Oscillospiraceae bacterium]|nr:hypothetical protein [Oscillospiraceae bacterium]
MDWKREAEQELKQYAGRCRALKNIKLRHQALKEEMTALRGASTDRIPVRGGCSRMEDALVNNIVERQRLELTYKFTHKLVDLTKRGLDSLQPQERELLHKFYVEDNNYTADRLCEEMHLERSRIYRLKDQALYNFTISMYGIEKL